MAAAMGSQTQFGAGPTSTVAEKYELASGGMTLTEDFFSSEGLTGTRSHTIERTRASLRRASGTLVLHPNSVELDTWLPRIVGGTESTNVFPLAETLPAPWYWSEDHINKVWVFDGCVVDKCIFRGQQGGPMEMELQVIAADVTMNNAGTFPSLTINTNSIYMYHDAVITVGGSPYGFRSFTLTIDNMLDKERFFNNIVIQGAPAKDRIVTVELDGPYGDNAALYNTGIAGVAVAATFTNGARSVLFSCVKVQFPRITPTLNGKEEIMLPLRGIAKMSSTTRELVITNVS